MRFLLLLYLLFPATLTAQLAVDSRAFSKVNITIDSDTHQHAIFFDSLSPQPLKTIDSMRHEFSASTDSLQQAYQNKISPLESKIKQLNNTIDSRERFNLSNGTYNDTLKDITEFRKRIESQFDAKLNAFQQKTVAKLNALNLPAEYAEILQEVTSQIEGVSLNSTLGDLAGIRPPDLNIPEINGMSELPSLNEANVQNEIPGTPNIQTPAGNIDKLSQHVEGYEQDIKSIAQGDIENIRQLPETIEDQASKIDGMDEIQKQSGLINEHKADLEAFNDPKKAKEKVVEIAKKAAVDHFAGKEGQLKVAMDKLSKYKKKYGSFSSIKNLPKRRPNAMKGKPMVERLVPGLYLQYQQKNLYLIDVNPYLGYKLSGKFTTGMGWNHRYAWDSKDRTWNQRSKIFGPRAFVDLKLGKGFIAHLEGESMNSFVPSILRGNPDSGQREWVWSAMIGIKKEYKIYKNLKGTALLQYNLFNRFYKAPYVDRLNSRIGFEYTLKRGKKNQQ